MTMAFSQRAGAVLAGGLLTLWGATAGIAAETTVQVVLGDKGPDSVMMDPMPMMGMGKGMSGGDTTMAMMSITLDQTEVPAGKVTFVVVNGSKDIIHEMLVSPIPSGDAALPYVADENRIDEEKAGHLGEVSELEPGKSGELTVDLTPGKYILFCNIPGHFMNGMWAVLTVKE
jgi:uncharacterized cupredoxin-like copper-binding protein